MHVFLSSLNLYYKNNFGRAVGVCPATRRVGVVCKLPRAGRQACTVVLVTAAAAGSQSGPLVPPRAARPDTRAQRVSPRTASRGAKRR